MAQGSLTPPGTPGPSMKSLDQIEPRKAVSSAPFVISAPGSYYLTTNLTVNDGNAITISSSDVTLDLGGWTISSTAPAANGRGIVVEHNLANIEIRNGMIKGGVTNDGSGVFSGPGFMAGIIYLGWSPNNARVSGVKVSGCSQYGIFFSWDASTLVESCTVTSIGGTGIAASTVRDSIALDCGGTAIDGRNVYNSQGHSVGNGHGIQAVSLVQNSYGRAKAGNGINSFSLVNGCTASSTAGIALVAENAVASVAYRTGGTAIKSVVASGCLTGAGTNNITWKYNMPN